MIEEVSAVATNSGTNGKGNKPDGFACAEDVSCSLQAWKGC